MTYIVANAKDKYQVGATLLAGCDARISELLALRIEKHISDDRTTLFIRQQRGKKGGVKHTLKTDAAYRDIDLHSSLAKTLDEYIGDRKEGFLFETRDGNMLSPESLYRNPEDNLQADGKSPRSLQRVSQIPRVGTTCVRGSATSH